MSGSKFWPGYQKSSEKTGCPSQHVQGEKPAILERTPNSMGWLDVLLDEHSFAELVAPHESLGRAIAGKQI